MNDQFLLNNNQPIVLIVTNFTMGENVLWKSIPSSRLSPLATTISLYLCTCPDGLYYIFVDQFGVNINCVSVQVLLFLMPHFLSSQPPAITDIWRLVKRI